MLLVKINFVNMAAEDAVIFHNKNTSEATFRKNILRNVKK